MIGETHSKPYLTHKLPDASCKRSTGGACCWRFCRLPQRMPGAVKRLEDEWLPFIACRPTQKPSKRFHMWNPQVKGVPHGPKLFPRRRDCPSGLHPMRRKLPPLPGRMVDSGTFWVALFWWFERETKRTTIVLGVT